MKKLLAILCMGMIAVSFIMAGGEGEGDSQLVINSNQSDPEPKRVFEEIVEIFREEHPEIEVVLNTFPHEDFKTLIRTQLASNDAPDVVTWFAGNRMRYFAEKGLLAPIGDAFPGGFSNYFPSAFETAAKYGDEYYFLPANWYWWAVYYRKSIFEEHGLEAPQTMDEFVEVATTLRDNDIIPITIGTKFLWPAGGMFDYLNMRINGLQYHQDLTDGKIAYTDSGVRETFDVWAQMVKGGFFPEDHSAYSWQEAANLMFTGKAAMYLIGQFVMDSAGDVAGDMDFFRFPVIKEGVGLYEDTPIDGFLIPAKAKNKEAALLFLNFLASKEIQEQYGRGLGRLAGHKDVQPVNPDAVRGFDMIKASDGVMQFYDRDVNPEMASLGMNAFVEFMNNPDDIDRILSDLDKERQRFYSE